jgi:hypothetical protein
MKSFGTVLSFLCALISIVLLWMGYVVVFEGNQVIPESESPLPEGADHWIRAERLHDLRAYTLWVLAVIGCLIIPPLAVIRSGKTISPRKAADGFFLIISCSYAVFWSNFLIIRLRNADWVLLPTSIMLAGCIYGILVFWQRVRGRIHAASQPASSADG